MFSRLALSLAFQVLYIDIREARARTCLLLALTFDPRLVQGVAMLPPHLSSLAKRMPPRSPASPSAARGDPETAAASELNMHRWFTINTLNQPPVDSGAWQLPPGYRVLYPRGAVRRPASTSSQHARHQSPTSSRGGLVTSASSQGSHSAARSPSSRAVMSARSPSPPIRRLSARSSPASRPGTTGPSIGGGAGSRRSGSPQNFQLPGALRSPSRMGSPSRLSGPASPGRPASSPSFQRPVSSGFRNADSPPPMRPMQQGGAQVAYISHSRDSSAPPSPSKKNKMYICSITFLCLAFLSLSLTCSLHF